VTRLGGKQQDQVPRPRGFRSGVASRGVRRQTAWSGLPDQAFIAVAAAGATLLSAITFEAPGTIVRSRGQLSVRPTSTTADGEFVGAFGVGLVSREAFDVGITAIPHPYRDADWGGWMVWQPWALRFDSITQAGVLLSSWSFNIDSKAMRKVEPNSAMVFVAESQGGAVSVANTVRILQMLH